MSFVHHHARDGQPAPTDLCVVIQSDQLLAGSDVSQHVTFPEYAQLISWLDGAKSPLYVGFLEGRPCWSFSVDAAAEGAGPKPWQWHDTRALLGLFTPAEFHAVSCARQLLWWDRRHQYCGVCGTPTVPSVEERARKCPRCAAVFFPVASPAIIVAVTRDDQLLLAHNRNFRSGMFSLLAGFVDPGETLEQAVAREVREEVGIEVGDIRYVTSQPWSFPNSLMIGFRAAYVGGELHADQKEIADAAWFSRPSLPPIPRAGTVARALIDAWAAEPG